MDTVASPSMAPNVAYPAWLSPSRTNRERNQFLSIETCNPDEGPEEAVFYFLPASPAELYLNGTIDPRASKTQPSRRKPEFGT